MANINAESAGSALDNLAQVCLVELELKCFDDFHLILWTRWRRRIYLEVTLLKRTRSKPWWLSPPRTMILQSICLTILQFRTDVSFQFRCRYMKIRGQGQVGPVPGNYCCFKCGMPGHWIKQCPLNLVRNYTPLSLFYFNISFLLKLLDDGYQEEHWNSAQFYGACRWARSSWRYDDSIRPFCRSRNRPVRSVLFDFFPVLPTILPTITGTIWNWTIPLFLFSEAYREIKKERPPFQAESPTPEVVKPVIPSELLCSLCKDLLSDAVLIPCCGDSFCDDCRSPLFLKVYLLKTILFNALLCLYLIGRYTSIASRFGRTRVSPMPH